jgi:mannose-6-phosphate isomerase class I
VQLADDSVVSLPALLRAHAEVLLGPRFMGAFGRSYPLLPKTLDIKELLSVQGHPPGHTEVYVILAAEPGATIRLGFRENVDAAALEQRLESGLAEQRALVARFGQRCDAQALQRSIAPWLAAREAGPDALEGAFFPPGAADAAVRAQLKGLKDLYWDVLDRMNVVPVQAGQVIYNATPARILEKTGARAAAEVHALGNPERREILALEIRRPGPTFRAWDNVRFPMRDIDIKAALTALNLERTRPDDFNVEPVAVPGRDGAFVSVDCEFFRLEHLRPGPGCSVSVPADPGHCLHAIEGDVGLHTEGRELGRLAQGRSAIVPIGVGAYDVSANRAAHVVRVSLPL